MTGDDVDLTGFVRKLEEVLAVVQEPAALFWDLLRYSFQGGLEAYEYREAGTFPSLPKHLELLPLDLLGKYVPKERRVEIYAERIRQVAEHLKEPEPHLLQVVRLHEWAHALVHVGQPAEVPAGHFLLNEDARRLAMDKACSLWRSISDDLHEQLAQLLTLHAVNYTSRRVSEYPRQAETLFRVFHRLSGLQPAAYRIDRFTDIATDRVAAVFDMLKRRQLHPSGVLRVLRL